MQPISADNRRLRHARCPTPPGGPANGRGRRTRGGLLNDILTIRGATEPHVSDTRHALLEGTR